MKLAKHIFICCILFSLAACSTIDSKTGLRQDHFEGFNRQMWSLNQNILEPYILDPLARGYKKLPKPVKHGTMNFLNNLDEPVSAVNSILQGEFKKAFIHLNRFWINAVFGLGGLIAIADMTEGLRVEEPTDFNFTLGKHGVGTGSYLMLPAYGPTTPRQLTGSFVDSYTTLSPLGPWVLLKSGIQRLDSYANIMDQRHIIENTPDPYIALREAYLQNLEFRTHGKNIDASNQPELGEDLLEDIDQSHKSKE